MSRTRTLTALFPLGRLALGTGFVASPERLASGWLGENAARPRVTIGTIVLGGGSAI